MFWSEVKDNHVFVFYNGEMIYKKWVGSDQASKIFDKGGLPPFDLPKTGKM